LILAFSEENCQTTGFWLLFLEVSHFSHDGSSGPEKFAGYLLVY
jgi:hypothetical protein